MVLDFLFSPETVEFLDLEEERKLTFRCKRTYKVGQTVRIRTEVPIGPKPGDRQKLQVPVVVTLVRPVPGKKKEFICQAEVPAGPKELAQVKEFLDSAPPAAKPDAGVGARRRPRHTHALRLLSKELPGFRALSVDFNPLGLQLQAEGEVEPGKVLTLDIELELSTIPRVLCQGVVRWCRQLDRKRYLIGLEFVEMPPEILKDLETFEQFLLAKKNASVMQKQIIAIEHMTGVDIEPIHYDDLQPAAAVAAVPLFDKPAEPPAPDLPPEEEISKRFQDPTA